MTVHCVVCGVSVSSSRGYGRCNALQCMRWTVVLGKLRGCVV
jgi:hypothetical protein